MSQMIVLLLTGTLLVQDISGLKMVKNFQAEPSNKPAPRMIHQQGCERSSFVQTIVRDLMELHGYEVEPTQYEPFNPYNPQEYIGSWYADEAPSFAEKAYLFLNRNKTVVFKSDSVLVDQPTIIPVLQKLGTQAVAVHRRNKLDWLLCKIRDEFADYERHKTVDESGQQIHDGMARRTDNKTLLAYIDKETIIKDLQDLSQEPMWRLKRMHRYGWDKSQLLSTSELLDYEWSNKKQHLSRAVGAWGQVMESLDVQPDAEKIAQYLKQHCGKRRQSSHGKIIYNFQEVQETLAGTAFAAMLRHDDYVPKKPLMPML